MVVLSKEEQELHQEAVFSDLFEQVQQAEKALAEAQAQPKVMAPQVPEQMVSTKELGQWLVAYADWRHADQARSAAIDALFVKRRKLKDTLIRQMPSHVWVQYNGWGFGISRSPNGTSPELHIVKWGPDMPPLRKE